jgi:hypothetical protein
VRFAERQPFGGSEGVKLVAQFKHGEDFSSIRSGEADARPIFNPWALHATASARREQRTRFFHQLDGAVDDPRGDFGTIRAFPRLLGKPQIDD